MKKHISQAGSNPSVRDIFQRDRLPLSELPDLIDRKIKLDVPVYTVWGACEDVQVLEKLRSGEYKIDNLHIIDEAHSRLLDVGGIKLRLLGLGGAVVMHKLFDNGEGRTTIAGGQGTMWTTLLQMGELIDTANRVYDPTETRVFVTHASPAREGLLNQLSVTLKADFSISAGLHFRYGSSYNEFSVNPTLDHYRGKLAASRASFYDVWETVKGEVEPAVESNEAQKRLLDAAINVIEKMPSVADGGNPFGGQSGQGAQVDESAFKNMWNFNLADAAYGYLILDVDNGRIGTEMRAQGFNFAHRGGKAPMGQPQGAPLAPSTATGAPTGGNLPQQTGQPAQVRAPQVPQQPAQQQQQQQQTQQQQRQQQSQPPTQPAQQQQPKPSIAQVAAGANNAAPTPTGPKQDVKPATPQPTQSKPPASAEKAAPAEAKTNGTTSADRSSPKPSTPAAERKPVHGLFMQRVKDEAEARTVIAEGDRSKIERVQTRPNNAAVVHFSTAEDAQAALEHIDEEYKKSSQGKPFVQMFRDPGDRSYPQRGGRGGAGTWRASERGGAANAGYRSGGASDSEGGRGGRGGFRGGRGGRGGDRGDRGDRGGERGRGRGRGDFNKTESGGNAAPAAAAPSGGD